MKKCLIFGAAEMDIAKINVESGAFIIAADGGYSHLKSAGLVPDLIVGDFDGYLGELPRECEVIRVGAEKDDTDAALAVKEALSRGYSDIEIYGAVGGRLDHTVANIQLLEYISDRGGRAKIIGDSDEITIQTSGTEEYSAKDGYYFSLFALSEFVIVSVSGVKYPLEDYGLERKFPLGVSNEITGGGCVITVKDGVLLIIYSKK